MKFLFYSLVIASILSCNATTRPAPSATSVKSFSAQDSIQLKIDSLKNLAEEGDLIVRLGDDMLSYSIKFLSEYDHSYSHAGILIKKGNEKFVLHISPDTAFQDMARYEPVDSFINPGKNLAGGLYRYQLTAAEKATFLDELNACEKNKVRFDRVYDLKTDDQLYCSELIAKSLQKATGNQIKIKESMIPRNMLPLIYAYFQKEKVSKDRLAKWKYITIDNLYRIDKCREVMKVQLRQAQ